MIYDRYANADSLLCSAKRLFEILGLEILDSQALSPLSLADCGGYWARLTQKDDLIRNVAYNLALANALNATLVFIEEDAYANALYAKSFIESHTHIMREIETQYLQHFKLLYDSKVQMTYILDLLNTFDISHLIVKKFGAFSSIIVRGAYHGHLPKSTNHRIYEQIDLRLFDDAFSYEYYAHLFAHSPQIALHNTARCFFAMADLGVDFIITHSLSQFELLDGKRKKLCDVYNRDNIALPILFLPQVLLLAFGEEDRAKLGLTYHKEKVGII